MCYIKSIKMQLVNLALSLNVIIDTITNIYQGKLCDLFISPLCPAFGSEVTGQKKEGGDDKNPENSISKTMFPVKDIRHPMDARPAGKVFRGSD